MRSGAPFIARFSSDEWDRIQKDNRSFSPESTYARHYDRWGNRLSQTGSLSVSFNFDPATNHNISFSYDAAGNQINDAVHAYTYDAKATSSPWTMASCDEPACAGSTFSLDVRVPVRPGKPPSLKLVTYRKWRRRWQRGPYLVARKPPCYPGLEPSNVLSSQRLAMHGAPAHKLSKPGRHKLYVAGIWRGLLSIFLGPLWCNARQQ